METKTYMVDLNIQAGGYEKGTSLLIEAPDPETAGTMAIYLESHDEPEFDNEEKQSADDLGGEFHYQVRTVREVDTASIEVLKNWFPVFNSAMMGNYTD